MMERSLLGNSYRSKALPECEIDALTSETQKASSIFQRLSFNLDTGNWMEKEDTDDKLHSNFEVFDMVESDRNYNSTNEGF